MTNPFRLSVLLLIAFLISSCNKDETRNFDGLPAEVIDLISIDILNELVDLDMPIFEGNNPPLIEGSYLGSPIILNNSNLPEDDFE